MIVHTGTAASVDAYMVAPLSAENADYEQSAGIGRQGGAWTYGPTRSVTRLNSHLRDGWSEGAERIRAINATADAAAPVTVRNVRRRRVTGDAGSEVDVTAYWRGRGDVAWSRCVRDGAVKARAVHIVPMLCGVCTLTADQFFYRGAAAVRLADLLTEAGYNVAITAAAVGPQVGVLGSGEPHYAYAIPLKPYTAPLEINVLAAVLCEVGFTRHYVFRHLGTAPFVIGQHCGRYDTNGERVLPELARLAVPEQSGERVVYLPYDIGTAKQAEQWVRDQIAALDQSEKTE
jgi:hypothetical protein